MTFYFELKTNIHSGYSYKSLKNKPIHFNLLVQHSKLIQLYFSLQFCRPQKMSRVCDFRLPWHGPGSRLRREYFVFHECYQVVKYHVWGERRELSAVCEQIISRGSDKVKVAKYCNVSKCKIC